jgi:hypothetical protein
VIGLSTKKDKSKKTPLYVNVILISLSLSLYNYFSSHRPSFIGFFLAKNDRHDLLREKAWPLFASMFVHNTHFCFPSGEKFG